MQEESGNCWCDVLEKAKGESFKSTCVVVAFARIRSVGDPQDHSQAL